MGKHQKGYNINFDGGSISTVVNNDVWLKSQSDIFWPDCLADLWLAAKTYLFINQSYAKSFRKAIGIGVPPYKGICPTDDYPPHTRPPNEGHLLRGGGGGVINSILIGQDVIHHAEP